MSPKRNLLPLLAALGLACSTSPGTTSDTGTETDPESSTHATAHETAHATAHETGDGTAHATDHDTSHDDTHEPTSSTGHEHASTGHDTHDTHAETTATTGEQDPIAAYCGCMLVRCHDQYHATWGEDHEASEAMCAAAAAAVPSVGMPATMGNSLECRQHYCDLGEDEAGACDSAIGGGACV